MQQSALKWIISWINMATLNFPTFRTAHKTSPIHNLVFRLLSDSVDGWSIYVQSLYDERKPTIQPTQWMLHQDIYQMHGMIIAHFHYDDFNLNKCLFQSTQFAISLIEWWTQLKVSLFLITDCI